MARTPEWPVKCEKRRLISDASQPESGPADRLLAYPCSFLDLFLPVHSALLHSNGGSRNCTAPGSDPPRKAALMSRFAEDSTDRGSVVHFAQIFAILLANAGFLDREPDASEGRICRLFAGSFDQTSTKLCRAQLPASSGRISTHRAIPRGSRAHQSHRPARAARRFCCRATTRGTPRPCPSPPPCDHGDRQLVFTSSQAARYLGVSLATIRRWADAGHLGCYRTPGGQRRFSREQLDSFVDSLQRSSDLGAHTGTPRVSSRAA